MGTSGIISAKLRTLPDADLGDVRREIVHGEGGHVFPRGETADDEFGYYVSAFKAR